MDVLFLEDAWDDYLYWVQMDKQISNKINALIREIQRTPFTGTGKPEPLKFNMAGCWSRRINLEHRLVYKIDGKHLIIMQCRYHY